MRWVLLGIAVLAGGILWLFVKLDQKYKVSFQVIASAPGIKPVAFPVQVEAVGYDLLSWEVRDTLPLARLCVGVLPFPNKVEVRWEGNAEPTQKLCEQLHKVAYRPALRWILPQGADFVGRPQWIQDSVWLGKGSTLPSYEFELVAQIGKHRYPVVLPKSWYVYPETLWVEAEVDRFVLATVTLSPQVQGAKGYRVRFRPERVSVQFWIPEAYQGQWRPEDFTLLVPMDKVLPGDTVVFPELVRKPPYVRQVQLIPTALAFTRIY